MENYIKCKGRVNFLVWCYDWGGGGGSMHAEKLSYINISLSGIFSR